MRSDLHEPGRGWVAAMAKPARRKAMVLPPSIVDAALGDDSLSMAPAGARRDVAHAAASADDGEARAESLTFVDAGDGPLLRQLSQQLSLLEAQQTQIRRLLEHTEQRSRGVASRIDR
jgi:hypothetical protein